MSAQNYREGIRKVSALVSVVAAAPNNAINLYLLTAGRTCILRRLHIENRNAATTIIRVGVGVGVAFAQALPGWSVPTAQDREIGEGSVEPIPDVEFTANITVEATVAAAAPNDILVRAEVEEFQGPTG